MEEFNFLKEEFCALRKEIELALEEYRELQRNCVIATAVGYSWIATRGLPAHPLSYVAWAIPLMIPVCGAMRERAVDKHLSIMSSYIKTVEAALIPKDVGVVGWEHHLSEKDVKALERAGRVLWRVLIIFSVVLTATGIWQTRTQASSGKTGAAKLTCVPE